MKKEEALEQIRKWDLLKEEKEALETLIPELAESEDERIRKFLVDFFASYKIGDAETKLNGVRIDDILAYLEKQKEQSWMPTEEEMGVLYKLCYVSNQISDDDDTELTRLYQDLKREYFNGRSFENMFPKAEKEQKPAESISQLTVQGKGVYKICPRCKERMVRDDSMVYTSMPPQYRYECPKCGESECDTVMYDNPEMEEQKPAEYIKLNSKEWYSLLAEQYDKGFWKGKAEQKPAEWSEEDQKGLNRAINICISDFGEESETARFLKSLPGRFNLQPKAEWSEEDEAMRADTLDSLRRYQLSMPNYQVELQMQWLKSLRPQYHGDVSMSVAYKMGLEAGKASSWKPSEHQMDILKSVKEYVGKVSGYWGDGLGSLIDDLEKL